MANPAEGVLPVDTVNDLLVNALQDAGIVGIDESVEPAYLTRALRQANWVLAEWARQRWLAYRIADYSFVSNGSQSYSVGNIGANVVGININPRPDRLEYAFLRFLNTGGTIPVDIPLDIIPSHEDYSRIAVKTVGSLAWRIFYDPIWPVGLVFPWPVPQASLYEIHCGFKVVLPRFASTQQVINFPPEYEFALNWDLVNILKESYQMPSSPMALRLARRGKNTLMLANSAIGTLRMPPVLRNRGRSFDFYGDSDS